MRRNLRIITDSNKKRIKQQNKARKRLGMPLLKGKPKTYEDYKREAEKRGKGLDHIF